MIHDVMTDVIAICMIPPLLGLVGLFGVLPFWGVGNRVVGVGVVWVGCWE